MVNNSKILTVSYGTFSCTLEGFEDSFGTMKAIAEYFRDLAADDRYFGAEPPQPDADMLARIAQREVARQVEARTDDSGRGVILRAGDYIAPGVPVMAPAPAAPAPAAAPEPAPEPAAATPEPVAAEPVAAEVPKTVQGADPAPMTEAFTTPIEEPVVAPEPEPKAVTPAQVEAEEVVAEPVVADTAAPDSIAAKLQRIRAVVSHSPAPAAEDFAEDEHADALLSETVRDLSAAMEVDDAAEQTPLEDIAEDAEDEAPQDELTAVLEQYDAMSDEPETMTPRNADMVDYDESYEIDDHPGEDTDVLSMLSAIQASTGAAEDEEAIAPTLEDDVEEEVAPFALDDDASVEEIEEEIVEETIDVEEAVSEAIDLSAYEIADTGETEAEDGDELAIFDDLDSEDDDEFEQDELRNILEDEEEIELTPQPASSLSEDDEEDLLRELAVVESETLDGAEEALVEEEDDLETGASVLASTEEADEDLPRLMAAAEEKMGTEESSSNRETYSHMRAAVAVAKAERSAGGNVDGEGEDDAYREDLANVVRPRRPVAGSGQRPGRPEAQTRPAPLKLVAEQRIDLDEEQSRRGPVRPRRVSASEAAAASPRSEVEGDGFAKYASDMGATDLPDLLEAAASYLSFVEGLDQFSRPQLMRKLRQLDNHSFNREDGLRSFGQLLRQGKIEKTGAGRFTASGDIGFRPDEREAG